MNITALDGKTVKIIRARPWSLLIESEGHTFELYADISGEAELFVKPREAPKEAP